MRHGSLFSGIGGFDFAAEWMVWENVFHCEWNIFGQKVLKYYWPNAISYDDITKTDFSVHRGAIDILTGGFPCQPYSAAGKRLGKEDERHLWPEMLRVIREVQPTWVVGENVLGLVNWNGGLVFEEVQADLEAEGYEVQPYVLPAVSVNAPHRRDRVWFVAYSESMGRRRRGCETSNKWEDIIQQSRNKGLSDEWTATDPNSNGLIGSNSEHEVNTSQGGEYALRNTITGISDGDASDTENTGQPSCTQRQGEIEPWRGSKPMGSGQWDTFPTVSPVHTRNDGISDRLDTSAISFSKWRNESIKASGNAIVPQVAYQIFKSIQQYEHDTTRNNPRTPA